MKHGRTLLLTVAAAAGLAACSARSDVKADVADLERTRAESLAADIETFQSLRVQGANAAAMADDPGEGGIAVIGATGRGTLAADDPTLYEFGLGHGEIWLVAVSQDDLPAPGRTVTITARSNTMDMVLIALDQNTNILAADDDSGGGFDARLSVQVPADQFLFVLAAAYPDERGSYTLEVR